MAQTDELRVGGLTLRGVTIGGVQTCLMVPELGVMFDVGGSIGGQLRHSTILVSHGHQDHLGGLPFLVSQRHMAGLGAPDVHVPAEAADPLRRIFTAWAEIEGFELEVNIIPHDPEDRVELGKGLTAVCVRSVHRIPSLAWIVERKTHKLKPALADRPREEIKLLREQGTAITDEHVTPLICVSGDTQIELFAREPRVRRCKVLVYEVTSWDDRRTVDETRKWGHTHVDEVIEQAESFEGDALVLVHRSPRHTRAEAEAVVRARFPSSVRGRVHVFGR